MEAVQCSLLSLPHSFSCNSTTKSVSELWFWWELPTHILHNSVGIWPKITQSINLGDSQQMIIPKQRKTFSLSKRMLHLYQPGHYNNLLTKEIVEGASLVWCCCKLFHYLCMYLTLRYTSKEIEILLLLLQPLIKVKFTYRRLHSSRWWMSKAMHLCVWGLWTVLWEDEMPSWDLNLLHSIITF